MTRPTRNDIGGRTETREDARMLTESLPAFERRMARQYPDWREFIAWVDERRYGVFATVASMVVAAVLMWLPAGAQDCDICPLCPCLPVAAEPTPLPVPPSPPGGTIPPVTGIHWPSVWLYLPVVANEGVME